MITIESLSKKYGGRPVVDDITFTARQAASASRPQQAGKSTSMR